MRVPTNRESQTRSCSCRITRTGTRMDQASGWRESNLQLLLFPWRGGKQRCRCRERSRDRGKRLLQESMSRVLPGICVFNFLFKVRRPGISHQQPHQQRRRHRKASLIEEPNRNETKNQVRTPPEPDVLMKHVEYGDRKHKQDVFHRRREINKRVQWVSSFLSTDYTDSIK